MSGSVGQPIDRVDGPAKVGGKARYAADFRPSGVVYGAIVTAAIAKGRIAALDTTAAEAIPGVISVIHHGNAPQLAYAPMDPRPIVDPKTGEALRVFQNDQVLFAGQPIALVVAEEPEQAIQAAALVRASYAVGNAASDFSHASLEARPPEESRHPGGKPGALRRGDADAAFAAATRRVDASYEQPAEFHCAIELHGTIARWDHDHLTLWDKTQWVDNDRTEMAHVFGIPDDNVRVISPFVGGAFGSALRSWPHVAAAALASLLVNRPVELVLTRRQQFSSVGYRPRTVQRVRLGADDNGRLTAVIHEAVAQTSAYEEYAEMVIEPPAMLYSTPTLRADYRLAPMNVNTPCPMRAPGIVTGTLALELAMDELAEACDLDPLRLRLLNYAERDENKNLPWSSKSLRQCYAIGAERFGWSRRPSAPASRRDGHWLVGYGMASAVYPAHRAPATAHAELRADGTASVTSAASDMGPGTYTSMTQVAADELGLPINAVQFELGDSLMPPAPVHGGSMTMASVGSAVQAACRALRAKALDLEHPNRLPQDRGAMQQAYARLLARHRLDCLTAETEAMPDDAAGRFSMYAFGAVFAEVRVDAELGEIRVPRLLGVYAAGRIVNPKTARSQCIGGMVGGLGMALTERGQWDDRFGKIMNASLADYLVPVNADVQSIEALFVPEEDPWVNPLGVKGVGEIALVGVAPAILNAIHNATGRRIRSLPATLEKVMGC